MILEIKPGKDTVAKKDMLIAQLVDRVIALEKKAAETVEELDIQINYHKEKYPELLPVEKHGNFYDLRAAENIILKKDVHTLIPLGISIKLPKGYYAQINARSSSFKNFGFILANSTGIIDTSYCGPDDLWFLPVIPSRDQEINLNDRIAQFTIVKEVEFNLEEGIWEADNRGGYGHSGI